MTMMMTPPVSATGFTMTGTPTTSANQVMIPRCTMKFEKCTGGMKVTCICDDEVSCQMLQNLCTSLAGGTCAFCCTMNGVAVCTCCMTMCHCKCELVTGGCCFTCTSGDKECCAMVQACCDCLCAMTKAGCACCVMMGGVPVCCCC